MSERPRGVPTAPPPSPPPPRRPVAVALTALAALTATAATGCASTPHAPSATGAAAPGPPPATLPAHAVPGLDSHRRVLRAADLAREAALPGLAGQLAAWGYEAGAARSFQGQSRRLQVVESRTLRFASPAGAASFVAFVRAHPGSFLGGAVAARPFASHGRRGLLVRAAPCACHLATPAYLAVVAGGRRVSWLEVNGPRAAVRALRALAARAP